MNARREARSVLKHYRRFQHQMGENIVWFPFDPSASVYDDVYNEGGRRYKAALNVPVLWVDQDEAVEQYTPEGRRPTMTLRFAISSRMANEAGLSDQESHGHRVYDQGLMGDGWFDDRLNDVVYYNGRYFEVANYQIRGRIKNEDVILGVTATEVYPEDETLFDFHPARPPYPYYPGA